MDLILLILTTLGLGFLTYQDIVLNKTLDCAAWKWEIVGIFLSFGRIVLYFGLSYFYYVPEWFKEVSPYVVPVAIGCLIISRHLLHKYQEGMKRRSRFK